MLLCLWETQKTATANSNNVSVRAPFWDPTSTPKALKKRLSYFPPI